MVQLFRTDRKVCITESLTGEPYFNILGNVNEIDWGLGDYLWRIWLCQGVKRLDHKLKGWPGYGE